MPRRVGATLPSILSIKPSDASRVSSVSNPSGGAMPSAVRRPSMSASAPALRRASGDVLARLRDVPPAPGPCAIRCVGMRPRAGTIHRLAAPVSKVVTRFVSRLRPVGHLVPPKARALELRACGVQLVPLQVGIELGELTLGAPAPQKRSLLESQAVGRNVIRAKSQSAPQGLDPGLAALMRHRVYEIDAQVLDAHRARQVERMSRLSRIRLALEDRERARFEPLHAEAHSVDTALEPGGDPRFIGAGRIGLERDLRVGCDVERAADETQQMRDEVWRKNAGRSATEVDGLQAREVALLPRGTELALQRLDIVRHDPVHAGVGVEVAIATFVLAERQVDVEVLDRSQVRRL